MAISVRLSEAETKLIKAYAELNNMSVSDLVRTAVLEKIEDEFDLKLYYKAIEEHQKNPVTYSHEEMRKMLGID